MYERIRPTGFVRPRMYGLPKVHKPKAIPLRPILSMVGSAQHELARWLAEVIRPVLQRYSANTVKDSFSFCADLQDFGHVGDNVFMCSFDVVSLFTNVPIDEAIQICLDTLYRSDIKQPKISEELLKKLLYKATCDVEFSFNDSMFRQVDGVPMGSPLGPVLANIFLGFWEDRIPNEMWPRMYRRFVHVDDTFSVVDLRERVLQFLDCLNGLHKALKFIMESEEEGQLPFLDVLVMKEAGKFATTIYRKPTFTGLYTRWDSYCATSQKIALLRSLTQRGKKICSPQHLGNEITKLKSIFSINGYPEPIVDRVMRHVLESGPGPPAPAAESRKLDKVYIRLPWLGPTSTGFKNRIFRTTREASTTCTPVCVFTTRRMLSTRNKDVLPAVELSNVIYLFNCACGPSNVGRTSQRLEERIRQHVPVSLVAKATCHQQQEPAKKPVETKHTMVLRSQSRGAAAKKITSEDEASDDEASDDGALEIRKSDSSITRHLKESAECREKVCPNLLKCFTILAKARNSSHLGFLEAIFIARRSPVLCSQKEFVRSLALL